AGEGSCPAAEALAKRVLSLPMHPYLEADTVERIAALVRSAAH
ncbi:MAG: DegT/DnrJ/EryC1/StrS family aminotransferase, partial [Alphaproteobacteria bacterium]